MASLRHVPDKDRLLTGLAAVVIAMLLAVTLLFVGRSVNRPPVIETVEAAPQPVPREGWAVVKVKTQDPDGETVKLEYKAASGKVVPDPTQASQARYSPRAEGPVVDRVVVTATDTRGLQTTAAVAITVESAPVESTPTPEPTLAPIAAATLQPVPTATPKPTRRPVATQPPPPPQAPTQAATRRPNRPPILQEGTNISELGENPIVLVATGSEPDGEPVTFSWDFGPCLESKNVTQFEAEVKLIGQCSYAVATLTWADPMGATASAQWTINK